MKTTVEYQTDRFTKWILMTCASLIALGVAGLWQMSTHVATLDERMAQWTLQMTGQVKILYDRDSDLQNHLVSSEARIREHEASIIRDSNRIDELYRRIDILERGRK